MATNPEIRDQLRAKLGNVTHQALSQRVKRLKRDLPVSFEDGVYVLAHEQGIDIARHLDSDELARVRELLRQRESGAPQPAGGETRKSPPRGKKRAAHVKISPSVDVEPLLRKARADEAKRMAEKAFPLLYVFENSIRDLISLVLEDVFGTRWWDKIAPKELREKAQGRRQGEDKTPWIGRRGAHPIFYIDLGDLPKLIRSRQSWPHFKAILPDQQWFSGLVDDVEPQRNIVAHMNPISSDDLEALRVAVRKWSKQLESKRDQLPV
jgi:hypothetical protein